MAWPRDAYVGQKVVVYRKSGREDIPQHLRNVINRPRIGRVYTIATINVWPEPKGVLITLREVDNSHLADGRKLEPGFPVECFRPVDPASKKADRGLAALKDGIKTVREREDA